MSDTLLSPVVTIKPGETVQIPIYSDDGDYLATMVVTEPADRWCGWPNQRLNPRAQEEPQNSAAD